MSGEVTDGAADAADPAIADRRRLEALIEGVAGLVPADPEPLRLEVPSEWSAGFAGASGVRVTVLFVRDPAEREEAARALRGHAGESRVVRVATNGGMLLHASGPAGEHREHSEQTLHRIASRFAGRE